MSFFPEDHASILDELIELTKFHGPGGRENHQIMQLYESETEFKPSQTPAMQMENFLVALRRVHQEYQTKKRSRK